jgi:hypothetical protein
MKACRGSVGKPKDHLEDLGIGGKIILKWILRKFDGMAWTGIVWFRTGGSGRLL